MVRKLAAALLGVGVLVPGLVQALGLGGIKLNSALSEPLDAEIELVQVRELTADEIIPNLASNADFSTAGVEKFHFLTEMKFEVVVNPSGRSFIRVTSRKPMKEPFVNFLVEVNWPEGRLLREYTMLLDPPVYRPQAAPAIRQPVTSAVVSRPSSQASVTTSAEPRAVPTRPAVSRQAPTATVAGDGSYGPTGPSDSLWSIAQQLRPSNRVNIHQTMLAIQALNPQAFLNGNINLLKKGQILRAPTEADAIAISAQDAIRMVDEQNRAWRERAATPSTAQPAPVDTSGVTPAAPAPVQAEEGKLTLVSADSAKSETSATNTSAAGGGDGGTGQVEGTVLRDKLSLAEENADKFKLENEDLKLKLNDLQQKTETTVEVIKLKDDQIADMQARMAAMQAQLAELQKQAGLPATAVEAATPPAADATTSVTPETPVETAATPEAAQVDYNYAAEESTQTPAEISAAPADAGATAGEGAATTESAATAELSVTEPAVTEPATPAETQPSVGVENVQKPQLVTEQAAKPAAPEATSKSLTDEILSNWVYLAGIAGVGVLGLASMMFSRRRKDGDSALDDALEQDFSLPSQTEAALKKIQSPMTEAVTEKAPEAAPVPESSSAPATVPQTSDVVGEADIYIAYGRFGQAIDMLERAAVKEPARMDIRVKLLEAAADSLNEEVFERHYAAVRNSGDGAALAKANQYRNRVGLKAEASATSASSLSAAPAAGVDVVAPVVAATVAASVAPAVAEPVSSKLEEALDAFDFDAGELDLDKTPAPTPVAAPSAPALDFGLDFKLDGEATKKPAPSDNSLDFDLELDVDKDILAAPSAPAMVVSDELPALDFHAPQGESAPASLLEEGSHLDLHHADDSLTLEDHIEDAGMDFEVVEDLAPASRPEALVQDEDDVRHALDFEKESTLDAGSAAMLADELALDEQPLAAEAVDLADDFNLDDQVVAPPAAPVAPVIAARTAAPAPLEGDDLEFITDGDESSTKLDLARAYIDMGDRDGARDILDEVLSEGNAEQKREASELLARLE